MDNCNCETRRKQNKELLIDLMSNVDDIKIHLSTESREELKRSIVKINRDYLTLLENL
jgi:hypothetical protein